MFNKKIPHIKLIFAIVVSYILIKLIDNYAYFLSIATNLINILKPFLLAFIIAYILNPLMSLIERKFKLKRSLCILLTYGFIMFLLSGFIIYLIPKLTSSIFELVRQMPDYSTQAQVWINTRINNIASLLNSHYLESIKNGLISAIPKLNDMLKISLDKILAGTISLTTLIVNLVFAFVIAIYILYDKEKFIKFGKKLLYIVLKRKNGDRFLNLFRNLNSTLGIYIGAKAIDSAMVALVAFIGLAFFKSPYAIIIALIVGITNMIPYFGPFLGMIPAFLINVFYSPVKALWILVFLIILQQIEGNILEPKFIGSKVGISPFLTILAVTLGGGLFGIIGMILGVPIMATANIYIDRLISYYDVISKKDETLQWQKLNKAFERK